MRNDPLSQGGVALIVSLIMLAAVTLIGVFVMTNSRLEWLMSGNTHFQTEADFSVEAALKQGEDDVNLMISDPVTFAWNNPGDQFFSSPLPKDPRNPSNWPFTGAATGTIVAPSGTTTSYLVEYMGCRNLTPSFPGATCTAPSGACLTPGNQCIDTFRIWAYSTDNATTKTGAMRLAQATLSRFHKEGASQKFSKTTFERTGYAEVTTDQPPSP